MRAFVRGVLLAAMVSLAAPVLAQTADPGSTFRVFLKTGEALPTYGSYAIVDDRVVFNLVIGPGGSALLQLMSLPVAKVDLARTAKYSEALRAAYYLATRAEIDYREMTGGVANTLTEIRKATDPKQRLQLAEDARKRLIVWPVTHYNYKAEEVRETTALFDDVIADLRAAAGESAFSLELSAGTAAPALEPLLAAPDLRQSVSLALAAATAADNSDERLAILRTAGAVVGLEPGNEALTSELGRRIADEQRIDAGYAALGADLRARASAAARKGDVVKAAALPEELTARDRALGSARPELVTGLRKELTDSLEEARTVRLRLDHHAAIFPVMMAYEQRVRPALSAVSGLTPVLEFIRDMRGMAFERLINANNRLERLIADFGTIEPPAVLADVHATIGSTLHMAREACARRRLAVVANDMELARQASSAAAGALLLVEQARADLLARLFPRKQQ